jgi:hypothetical protein
MFVLQDNSQGQPYFSGVDATSFFQDSIGLPSTYHLPAFLTFSYTAIGSGGGRFALVLGSAPECQYNISPAFSGTLVCTVTQKLFPGNTYDFEVDLEASADVALQGPENANVLERSNWRDTAFLSSIQLFDQNMNPLNGVQLVSGSGFDYQDNVLTGTPEPNSIFLISTAMFIGLGLAKARISAK